jgi:LacI family transcriptional regulator
LRNRFPSFLGQRQEQHMAATMHDVAARAGVSKSTVSHVLNSTRFVEPETEARVRRAIRELRYQPNLLARSLRRRETSTIGLMVPHIASPFWAELVYAVERTGSASGYGLLLSNSNWSTDKERDCMRMLLAKQPDGIVLALARVNDADLSDVIAAEVPVVLINEISGGPPISAVVVDEYRGGYLAGQYLARLGHRRAGCITSPSGGKACLRAAGFRKAFADAGVLLPDAAFFTGDFEYAGGVTGIAELLQRDSELTAVFTANDSMAMGVLKQMYRMQRRVPEDISVVGFDNISSTTAITPEMTTVAQPIAEIGAAVMRLLIDQITHRCIDPQTVVLQPTLVERESCCAIPTPGI